MPLPALFLLWMATLGADRVDLAGGLAPFRLVPFLALTPPLAVVLWLARRARNSATPLSQAATQQGALTLAALVLLGLSLLQSEDLTMSAGRLALLAATALGATALFWMARDFGDFPALVVRGAQWGLAFNAACNALTALALIGWLPDGLTLGPVALSLEPTTYGDLPRLSGATLDMNRGAVVALVFGTFIAVGPATKARSAWILLAALLVIGSLSRSALLAAVPIVLLAPGGALGRRGAAVVLGGVALAAALLLDPGLRERGARTLAPLAERFDPREGSAQTHAHLFERGLDLGTRSVPQAMLGIGYGTSFRVLADVFGGDPYGNFHSTWLALWVEAGIVAMLLVLALSLLPLRHGPRLRGLVLGLFVFNVFYISLSDPLYWFALGMAWAEGGA